MARKKRGGGRRTQRISKPVKAKARKPAGGGPSADETSQFSIAVAGAMNPAIHSPDWYRSLELLSDEELQVAKGGEGYVCTRVASQFVIPELAVQCSEQRWLIRGPTTHSSRLVDFACRTFDTLTHTPVVAYGINFDSHVRALDKKIHAAIYKRASAALNVTRYPHEALFKCSLRYSINADTRQLNLTIEPSVFGEEFLFISSNYHHPIVANGFQQFDLAQMIRAAASREAEDFDARRKSITEQIMSVGA